MLALPGSFNGTCSASSEYSDDTDPLRDNEDAGDDDDDTDDDALDGIAVRFSSATLPGN